MKGNEEVVCVCGYSSVCVCASGQKCFRLKNGRKAESDL